MKPENEQPDNEGTPNPAPEATAVGGGEPVAEAQPRKGFGLHGVALLSLFVVAVMSILSSVQTLFRAEIRLIYMPFIAVAIWWWLLVKIWTRPRKWGLGVGLFLLLIIPLQCKLFQMALSDPRHLEIEMNRS